MRFNGYSSYQAGSTAGKGAKTVIVPQDCNRSGVVTCWRQQEFSWLCCFLVSFTLGLHYVLMTNALSSSQAALTIVITFDCHFTIPDDHCHHKSSVLTFVRRRHSRCMSSALPTNFVSLQCPHKCFESLPVCIHIDSSMHLREAPTTATPIVTYRILENSPYHWIHSLTTAHWVPWTLENHTSIF